MNTTSALVRGAALSAAGVCVSMAALLITGKMFTNVLSREQVGVFSLLLVCSDFVIIAVSMGMSVSLPKLAGEAEGARREAVISAALSMQTVFLAAAGLLVIALRLGAPQLGERIGDSAWTGVYGLLYLLPALFLVGGLRDLAMAGLAGLERYGFRAAGITVASVAQVALVYLAVWRWHGGVLALVLATAASYALALGLLWAGLGRAGRLRIDPAAWSAGARFSAPLYANQLLTFVCQRFDTVLVTALLGIVPAAVFEMVKRLPVVTNRVMGALLVPYLPRLARLAATGDRDGAARLLNLSVSLAAFLGYGLALSLVAAQNLVIRFLFNRDYLTGAPALGLLLVASALLLQSGLMGQTLIALNRSRVVPRVNVGMAMLSLTANLALIPVLGLVGAGCAAVIASGFSFAMQAYYVRRSGMALSAWNCVVPQGMVALALLLLWALPPDNLWLRLSAPALFAVACLLFGVVTPAQITRLIRAFLPGT